MLVALRPEYIRLAPADGSAGPNQFSTVVEQVIYRGQHTQFLLRRPSGEAMTAIRQGGDSGDVPTTDGIVAGTAVIASWDAARNRLVRDDQ